VIAGGASIGAMASLYAIEQGLEHLGGFIWIGADKDELFIAVLSETPPAGRLQSAPARRDEWQESQWSALGE
jgi:hypothetical protein